jgi:hypothetical protein
MLPVLIGGTQANGARSLALSGKLMALALTRCLPHGEFARPLAFELEPA